MEDERIIKTKITYGGTIYSDDTVAKRTYVYFATKKDCLEFWRELEDKSSHRAYVDELSIYHRSWIPSEEYFKIVLEEGEEE